ncbi:phenylalanine--tRNA ligase subunit alpha [Prochlorococcus sp. AH-736-M13]|nr:phenylalanine--tRNA ligase subunit alpha [Prochlorococcus sp. AH-736-M13]MDA9746648.1 phenylalanine--tRNA ligase subunit alpha [Prochlorococcus sp. AH-736-M13]
MSQIESLSQIEEKLNNLSLTAKNNIDNSNTHEELDQLRVSLLGKKGDLSIILKTMGQLSATDRPIIGQKANLIKINLQELITERKNKLNSEALDKKIKNEKIDVTIPSIGTPPGNKHPLISTQDEIIDIFCGLGYSVESGPEIETDFYNFESLNIPKNHPARDMQDTFYLDENRLLRTHTSPVQIRYLEKNPPPVRIIAPGRVYRRDAVDATHSPVFNQVEVLCIDQDINFSHLRGTVLTFLKTFFGDIPVRFRASYFPFTEPSAEVDVQWKGKWLEVMGCGMVDPKVLEKLGIDSEKWTGFAAGLGVERFCMVRHQIDDIRKFYTNDIRFLEQF